MQDSIETIFILENPWNNIIKFATDYQLRYNDIIKEVFGVACLNDLSMMLQFNKSFQECICKKFGVTENKVSINQIIRVASKKELNQLKEELIENSQETNEFSNTEQNYISRPFHSIIKLREGIFEWDDTSCSYHLVKSS